jgi:hypothetical protein
VAGFPTAFDLGNYTPDNAPVAVRRAMNKLVAALGWDPRQSVRTARFDGRGDLLLPAMNVTSVDLDPVGDVTFTGWGRVTPPYGWAGTVTYTAGWADGDFPEVLADVVLEWAAAWQTNPNGLRSWGVGGETETYAVVSADPSVIDDPRLDAYRIGAPVA